MESQELIDAIVTAAKEIRADADAGNSHANAIIQAYMLYAAFLEQCAIGILEGAYEKWTDSKQNVIAE